MRGGVVGRGGDQSTNKDRSGTSQACTYRGNGRQGTAAAAGGAAAGVAAAWNSARLHLPHFKKCWCRNTEKGKEGAWRVIPTCSGGRGAFLYRVEVCKNGEKRAPEAVVAWFVGVHTEGKPSLKAKFEHPAKSELQTCKRPRVPAQKIVHIRFYTPHTTL